MFNKKEYMKKWNIKNPEYMKEYNEKYRVEHKEDIKRYAKKYYIKYRKNNKEKLLKQHRDWRGNNLGYNKRYYEKNKKKWKEEYSEGKEEYNKQWRKNNPEYFRKYFKNKRKTDLKYNINRKISYAIWFSLRGNKAGRQWESLVDYTLNDLIKRLEGTIPEGYTWQDFLNGKLHIDHIIPKSVFNYTKPKHTDFKRCWDLSNLQLLPAKENKIKYTKITKPFQLALKI